jgi:ADP-L-glycero-D-manno-heptose 6-epimerase
MIYITGGAGFIGSNLVARFSERALDSRRSLPLRKQGPNDDIDSRLRGNDKGGSGNDKGRDGNDHGIIIADELGCEDKWRNISKHLIHALIPLENTVEALDAYADEITAVFHLGAISTTTETDADKILNNNFTLSAALWGRCIEYNISFIYASSAATYGDGACGFEDTFTQDSLSQLRPLNPYGWSKHLFDRWVCHQVENGLPTPPQWAGLKFFNVYGPNETHKGSQKSVVASLVPQILETGTAKLFKSYHPDYADGGQLRDFVYVDDCVGVMEWLHANPQVSGLFNVGTGKARSFKDLALATFAALGKEPQLEYIDMPVTLRDKYQYFTQASMDRLFQAGYPGPMTSLEDGVRDYVQNYLTQADGYR